MTAKDRRRNLYQKINQAKLADPRIFARRAIAADSIAQQAFRSSRIEGCNADLDDLRDTAAALVKTRK